MSVIGAAMAHTDADARSRVRVSSLAVPAALYFVALTVRAAAVWAVPFALNEGSAYYVAVARNIATGRGPVIDALWSYATPPLTLPRAAFELWQPLASYLAAAPMGVFGATLTTAQLAFAAFGALLAPLTWWIARDAARRLELPANRQRAIAIAGGLLASVAGPLVLSAAVPDSTLPFTVLATAACVTMPAAARGSARATVVLGLLLGFAYLTRMEAVYLGIVFIGLAWQAGARGRLLIGKVSAVALIGAMVAAPWWLRNLDAFATPLPGQLAQNMFMTRNEQIFAWADPATLSGFLAQGPLTIAANVGAAAWHDAVDVLLLPAAVVTIVGTLTLLYLRATRHTLRDSALGALLAYGAICLVVTTVLFPVATLWGTFEHAAGPLIVALCVLTATGGDAFVARVRRWRNWPRPNAWLAPAALVALTLTLTTLQVSIAASQASTRSRDVSAAAAAVRTALAGSTAPVITDQPIWMSDALGSPAIALPDESGDSVLDLARHFGATLVAVNVSGARFPAELLATPADNCFLERPVEGSTVVLFQIAEECR